MNFEDLLNDSVEYTTETFAGHWIRWLIFVLLGLPFSLVRFAVDPTKIFDKAGFHPEAIHWVPLAILLVAGILTSFFIGGYLVRIYRGIRPAPDFTNWASLFVDGIKLDIVILVWFLPALVVLLAGLALVLGMFVASASQAYAGFSILLILLICVEIVLFVVAILFMIPGAVRFARTGSMAEGWHFSALRGILGRIGWLRYVLALILLVVIELLFTVVISLPAIIPYVGWIVPVCLAPLLTVFSARYFTFIYEAGELPTLAPPIPAGP